MPLVSHIVYKYYLGTETRYLWKAFCCMKDFLSVAWVGDANFLKVLIFHHVTSLNKCTFTLVSALRK